MLPDDTGRGQSGAFLRAVSAPRPDPTTDGFVRALRSMVAANVAVAELADDLEDARLGGPGAEDAHRRARGLVRVEQRELAAAMREIVEPPGETG